MALPGMLTLGTTLRCWEALVAVLGAVGGFEASWCARASPCTSLHYIHYKQSVLRPILRITDMARVPPKLLSGPDAAAQLSGLLARVQAAWRVAASATLHAPGGAASAPPAPQVWLLIAQSLGWRQGAAEVPGSAVADPHGEAGGTASARACIPYDALRVRHLAFIQEAYNGAAPPAEANSCAGRGPGAAVGSGVGAATQGTALAHGSQWSNGLGDANARVRFRCLLGLGFTTSGTVSWRRICGMSCGSMRMWTSHGTSCGWYRRHQGYRRRYGTSCAWLLWRHWSTADSAFTRAVMLRTGLRRLLL